MEIDRRTFLTASAGSAFLPSCQMGGTASREGELDRLLAAHAAAMPERPGAGANHYPMAAEVLEILGHAASIEPTWVAGASLYAGEPGRRGELDPSHLPFGAYDRFGDWLDFFTEELDRRPWREVIRYFAPRLAPGQIGAAFHGVIRAGHAARALSRRDSPARRHELAVGLAYWGSRYEELPVKSTTAAAPAPSLAALDHPYLTQREDVDFFAVTERLTRAPIAPAADPAAERAPADRLTALVRDAATGLLEMLIQERHRIWLLHTVTGPASVGLLLPFVDDAGARRLVAFARQAVVAMFAGYGAPFEPGAHLREVPPEWPELVRRAVASRSVHTLKLLEALQRFDTGGDPLCRTVAVQFLEWE